MESMHAIIQPTKAMQRSYDHLFIMYTLISFTSGLGATSLVQRNKEKPHQRQGGRLDLWGLYVHGALRTERAPRGRAGYLVALETTRWVRVRRHSVALPTAPDLSGATGPLSDRSSPMDRPRGVGSIANFNLPKYPRGPTTGEIHPRRNSYENEPLSTLVPCAIPSGLIAKNRRSKCPLRAVTAFTNSQSRVMSSQ